MFTVLFAIPRTVGWLAHWQELLNDPEQKISRPRQWYTGVDERDYSERTAVEIDEEVRRIIQESYQQAKALLSADIVLLHKVAELLLEREVLDGADIEEVIRTHQQTNGVTAISAAGADKRA
jgi:hypothetical protein